MNLWKSNYFISCSDTINSIPRNVFLIFKSVYVKKNCNLITSNYLNSSFKSWIFL